MEFWYEFILKLKNSFKTFVFCRKMQRYTKRIAIIVSRRVEWRFFNSYCKPRFWRKENLFTFQKYLVYSAFLVKKNYAHNHFLNLGWIRIRVWKPEPKHRLKPYFLELTIYILERSFTFFLGKMQSFVTRLVWSSKNIYIT